MNKSAQMMIQGTTSDAGKSTLVAGLCYCLKQRGYNIAPFKPQNMALNSAVTSDSSEIGRAQAVQAWACGIEAHSDMNPILLKPSGDTHAQVIIQGKALNNQSAKEFHDYKRIAKEAVFESYQRLRNQYEIVLVEGAGSPAEINLRKNDIANMGFAEVVDCPVILIADIDRGGVFAHIVGTLELLSEAERKLIKGIVINSFRGDIELLKPGIEWLEQKISKPVLGVLPYLHGFHLEAEDALPLPQHGYSHTKQLKVIVPVLPRISNHTDFDALRLHPDVSFVFVAADNEIPCADLIILPGSKNVRADLQWLIQQGWQQIINQHLRYGGKLIGICGGFQMLGEKIEDPQGIEDEAGNSTGLSLLAMTTLLTAEKQLIKRKGLLNLADSPLVEGYEIHCGISQGEALHHPLINFDDGQAEGCMSEDGQIFGTYLHGLFDHPEALNAMLNWAGIKNNKTIYNYAELRQYQLERLADTIESSLDMRKIIEISELDSL